MSGMRAVIAPMIADRSFYQAIPGLLDAFPPDLRPWPRRCERRRARRRWRRSGRRRVNWSHPADRIRLGIAPTIPLHCSDEFMRGCRDLATEFGLPLQTHLAEVQRSARRRHCSVMA